MSINWLRGADMEGRRSWVLAAVGLSRGKGMRVCGGVVSGAGLRLEEVSSDRGLEEIQRLRHRIFWGEEGVGMLESVKTRRDSDEYDGRYEHLVVRDGSGEAVGTCRFKVGRPGEPGEEFYSEREFDLSSWRGVEGKMMEVGRLCVLRGFRRMPVVRMLWRGVIERAVLRGVRWIFGCCSMLTTDGRLGMEVYGVLEEGYFVPREMRVVPRSDFVIAEGRGLREAVGVGRVGLTRSLEIYLLAGARVCGPPACDWEFGTIDFLMMFDLWRCQTRRRRQ